MNQPVNQIIMNSYPVDHESEMIVLSSAIIGRDHLESLCEYTEIPEDLFSDDKNKFIFGILKNAYLEKTKLDISVVKTEIKKSGKNYFEDDKYLADLMTLSTVNVTYHLDRLYDLSIRRKMLPEIENLFAGVNNHKIDYFEAIDKINEIKNKHEISSQLFSELHELAIIPFNKIAEKQRFHRTGIGPLDDNIIGIFNKKLIVVAGAPDSGKTTLVLQILTNINNGLFISLEMEQMELYNKIISRFAEVDSKKLIGDYSGCNDEEKGRILKAQQKVYNSVRIMTVDKANNFEKIMSTIRKICRTKKVDVIGIDNVQLLQLSGTKKQRTEELDYITRNLKLLAKELDKPILLISHMTKESYNNPPTLRDLRGSGSIVQDADMIIFVWDDSLIIGKGRTIRKGKIDHIKLIGEYSVFKDIAGNTSFYK